MTSKCSKKEHFSTKDIPSLTGRIALVTGATGGIGYQTALDLAAAGATVLVGGRSEAKGKDAVDKIKAAVPNADVSFAMIDLGSLASVKKFATEYNAKGQALDILINNAGIMAPPERLTTSDNFEIQLGTNHLAHFALTGQLLPSLRRSTCSPRVVNVSSIAAKEGAMDFDDLNWNKSYSAWNGYRASKLANLLFTAEFVKRADLGNWGVTCISAHPGVAKTDLISNGPRDDTLVGKVINVANYVMSHPVEKAALPSIYAAVSPDAEKGGYYGPNGWFEMKGEVAKAFVPEKAKDPASAKRLWEESEKLTGVSWPAN